ncbi:MAG TPA: DUF1538 domain-containing protein [Firmicutes bacterium]|nr:DUF1538 domain-containing protein [Bacillota bacterium]
MLKDLFATFKSLTPIVLGLLLFQLLILKSPLEKPYSFVAGYLLSFAGLFMFLKGITLSLLPLGESVGANLPALGNKFWIIAVGFAIGYLATLAEPALHALAMEAEEISVGALPRQVLIHTVAIGFGTGMALGIAKILFEISSTTIVIPILFITIILTYFAPKGIVGIAFDSASATTGPINIPINMAVAIGLSKILAASDPLLNGFGLVGLTSLGAAISVLIMGIFVGI